jgi:hypothetical protein
MYHCQEEDPTKEKSRDHHKSRGMRHMCVPVLFMITDKRIGHRWSNFHPSSSSSLLRKRNILSSFRCVINLRSIDVNFGHVLKPCSCCLLLLGMIVEHCPVPCSVDLSWAVYQVVGGGITVSSSSNSLPTTWRVELRPPSAPTEVEG